MSNGLLNSGGGFADWDTTYVQNKENNMSSIDALFSSQAQQPSMPSNSNTNSKLKPYKNQLASTQSSNPPNPFLSSASSSAPSNNNEYVNPFVDLTSNSSHDVKASQHKSKQPSVNSIQEEQTLDAEVLDLLFSDTNTTTPNLPQTDANKANANNDPFYAFDFGLNDNNDNKHNDNTTSNGSTKLKENKRQPSSSDSYTESSSEEEEEEEEEDEDEQQNAEDEEEEESSSDEEINTKSMKLSPPKQQTKRVKKKRPSLTENEKAFNKLHTQFDPSLIGTVPVSQINEKTKAKQQQRNKKRNTEPISVHSQRQKQLQKEGLIKVGSPSSLQSPNVGKSIRDNDNNNDEDKKENHKAGNSSKKPSASSSAAAAKAKGKQKYNVLPELHRGTALLKYGRRGYPHFRQFNITADNENLRWFSSKKKLQQSSINVGCINEILTGQHTKEFRRIAWTTLTPASFSVIYDNKKKSLNLVAKSVDEMKMWVESLRVLRDKKRRGEHLAKLESLEIDVDFRDRNRPQSRHHSGNFLRSHETKEREVDPILQRKLIDDIAALRKQFQEIAREANNEIVQSTKEYESVEQILSELEERIEELDHEVRNTRNTKIAENDVWRTRIDLESLREKIKVITKQSKAQYKSSKRRWSVF
eukprot:CAMPEP_0197074714 /NCGR_PEP_ID=MMETSP1384-20130603/211248_1 /TAXON_ID=29189 /ORGANISM="Ammonia sp." /LENGTH=642 /DNA_ID=CAMNT_0042513555 /DNA_START=88 /DNA_END=2016 /DNA_ORIENTATION=+